MKDTVLIVIIAITISFFVTDAMACDPGYRECGMFSEPTTFPTKVMPLPSPRPPFTGEGLILPSLETQVSAPSGPPSAQHLKLVAEAQARAKESASQWWINFFNNK